MNTNHSSLLIGITALVFALLILLTSLLLGHTRYAETLTIIFVVLWLIVPSLLTNDHKNHAKKYEDNSRKTPVQKRR